MKKLVSIYVLLIPLFFTSVCYGEGVIRIGLLQEPKTLNIWNATDTWSSKVLSLLYPTLFLRDPDTLELVPFLAEEHPKLNFEEKSYTLRLRDLKWSDGTPFTAEDLLFTGETILKYKIPNFYNRWDLVKKIEAVDKRTVKFYLNELSPLFESRTLFSPVVQKKEWEPVIKGLEGSGEPLKVLMNHKVKSPVAIGPFVVSEVKEGAYIFLKKNPHFPKDWDNRYRGPHVNGIIFKIFGTTDTAILELKKGGLDYIWWNLPEGYLEDLSKEKGLKIYSSEKNALYFLGFNLKKAPMNDLAFRKAVAYLIDKEFIVKRLLQEKGIVMDSPISSFNTKWYCTNISLYGKGMSREERIRRAYETLKEAGYSWKVYPVGEENTQRKGKGLMDPRGEEIKRITILVPPADYDPVRAMAGTMIQEWLQEMGIDVTVKPMPFNAMMDQVKSRKEFDMVIMGYGNLTLDPDYLRRFFESEAGGHKGDNITGYSSQSFDQLARASSGCMDPEERRKIVCQMQKILSEELPIIPLYNPHVIEVVREDKFTGWVKTLGGVGNLWSFFNLKPAKNK